MSDKRIDGSELFYDTGLRRCPNDQCFCLIFFILSYHKQNGDKALYIYPPALIDFNKESIPSTVAATFEEALKCHANECFISSAIMIRKTLEEICAERNITDENLKKKYGNWEIK